MPVGPSATSLLMTGATLPDGVQGNPPPPGHPLIHHLGHAGLCKAQVNHINQFQTSYYHLVRMGLCRAQDPVGCHLTGSAETLCLLKCLNFRNFTPDDWCNLAP